MCCPETADLHLGEEVDQQPSATKQTHPPLNLEANISDTVANQLPAELCSQGSLENNECKTCIHIHASNVFKYTLL